MTHMQAQSNLPDPVYRKTTNARYVVPSLHKNSSWARGDLKLAHIGSLWGHGDVLCRQGSDRHKIPKEPYRKRLHRPLRNVSAFQGRNDILSNFTILGKIVLTMLYVHWTPLRLNFYKQLNTLQAKKLAEKTDDWNKWGGRKAGGLANYNKTKAKCVQKVRRMLLKIWNMLMIVGKQYMETYYGHVDLEPTICSRKTKKTGQK